MDAVLLGVGVAEANTVNALQKATESSSMIHVTSGRATLYWAVSFGTLISLRLLLDAPGMDPLVRDNEGLTSLDYARRTGSRKHIASV